MKMIVRAYDFETTGPVPKTCEPLQLGYVDADIQEDGTYIVLGEGNLLIQIEAEEVPKGAFGVHGISKEMTLEGCQPSVIKEKIHGTVLGYNNRSFDDVIARRYGAEITRSIDVFPAALRLKSEGLLEKANLGAAYQGLTGKEPEGAHDALADVRMTLDLIKPAMAFFKLETFSEFLEWLNGGIPNVKMKMPFGKHKGTPLDELPVSYITWMKENMDLHGDLKASIESL